MYVCIFFFDILRYSVWREREQDRLDRRYRDLYKDYLREYSQLALQQRNLVMSMSDTNNNVKVKKSTHKPSPDPKIASMNAEVKCVMSVSVPPNENNGDDVIPPKRGSKVMMIRRASTGSISFSSGTFQKRTSSNSDLSVVVEVDDNVESTSATDDNGIVKELSDQVDNGSEDKVDEKVENGKQSNDTDVSTDNKENKKEKATTNNTDTNEKTPCNGVVKKQTKRRKSVASIKTKSVDMPIRGRLDRRPTLPNVAIPFNYGN